MTKKHYIKFAEVLKTARKGVNEHELDLWYQIYDGVVEIFKSDNPRFDADRFYTACTGIPH